MAAHRHHGVVPVCRVLQVAPSAVRSAMSRPVCARRVTDDAVKPLPLEVFNANYKVYGRRKIYRQGPWRGLDDVEFATMTYVDWFDHHRLHSGITNDASYTTPVEPTGPGTRPRRRDPPGPRARRDLGAGRAGIWRVSRQGPNRMLDPISSQVVQEGTIGPRFEEPRKRG